MKITITINDITTLVPCYTRDQVEILFSGREYVTPSEIAESGMHVEDKLCLLLALLPEREQHEAACHFAEEVAHLARNPEVARHAIATKRAWIRGEATDEELTAARAAAWVAAGDAAVDAASRAASGDAAGLVAWETAGDAAVDAGDAAREKQVAYLVQKVQESA